MSRCDAGKQLAFTRVDFTNASGELVAYGRMSQTLTFILSERDDSFIVDHTKYIGKSTSHPVSDIFFLRV